MHLEKAFSMCILENTNMIINRFWFFEIFVRFIMTFYFGQLLSKSLPIINYILTVLFDLHMTHLNAENNDIILLNGSLIVHIINMDQRMTESF